MEKLKILIIILFFLLTLSAFSKEETFYKFEKIDTENGLNDDFINDIIEDRSGKLWIASRKGINIYDGNEIEKPENDKNILSNIYVVRLIENENGEMFVITDNQLIKYSHQTKNLSKEISFDKKGREKFGVVKEAFYLEKYKELWIQRKIIPGEKNEIIRIFYDKLGITIEKYPLRENDFCRKIEKSHFTDDGNIIYLGTPIGIYTLDIKTWKSTQYIIPQEGEDSQELNYVEYITKDRNGEMWAVIHDGLVKIGDIRKQQYKVFKTGKIKDTNNINSLTKIAFDLNGNIWTIGSKTVAKLSSDERKLEEVNTIDNTGIEFRDIIFDEIGGVWISTSNGLYRMKKIAGLKDGYSVQWYGIEDGLQGIDFSQKASSYGSGGKLYFGGRNGYNVIYPEKMQEYFSIPELVINSMRVNDKKIEQEKLSGKSDKITLKYYENNVEFYYYARDLTSPDTIHYKYMLRGADKTWIDAKNQKSVRYSNLNPGKYTFLVMSTNYDGIWAVNTKEINFEIFPPFWKTWWAYLLYIVVMFSGVAVFVRIKTSFQKMEIEKQKIVVEQLKKIDKMKDEYNKKLEFDVSERTLELKESLEKLRQTQAELIVSEKIASIGIFAGGIAHEINSPLAGVLTSTQLIQLDIEDIGVEDNEVVKDSLRESLATIVAGVKKAKDIITKLLKYTDRKESEFSKIGLTALINNSLSLYEKEMKERKIELKINIEEDFEVNVNIREMTSAINNIIENAIDAIVLNGQEKGVIEITTSKNSESGASQIEIADNGLGMNEEVKQRMFDPFFTTKDVGKGMGLGMAVTYDIVKKHGGKIFVKSVLGEGTSIILELI